MKELFLVTTSLEETWPESDKPVLFLGDWCRLYSRKVHWSKFNSMIVPYHWDDRDKCYKDQQYLLELFERLLIELSTELNKVHGVSFSLRYWRIVIGPWLIMFLPTIFDRWKCIDMAITNFSVTNTKINKEIDLNYVPQCMEDFSNMAVSDLWNHAIYSSILKFINFKNISFIKNQKKIANNKLPIILVNRNKYYKIKRIIKYLMPFFSRNRSIFFIATYLGNLNLIKLQLRLGQMPQAFEEKHSSNLSCKKLFRSMRLSGFESNSRFEQFLKEVIPLQIPISYLEGYKELSELTTKIRWPKNPKVIWTSTSYFMNEVFKFWAAEKVDNGVPLVIGQHGGHYGQGLFSFSEYHELKICDHYLSWGWQDLDDKVIPVGALISPIKNKNKKIQNKSTLLLISSAPRYSFGLMSMPISGQWVDYFDNQMEFYENLPKNISNNVTVRLYPHDYEWSQFSRWRDRFPNSKIDECKVDFNKVLANTKLFISGWNSTTYLQSMMSNIPTVIFWDSKYFELRDSSTELFDQLRKVGIFHDNPTSAVRHVDYIYNDIDAWWNRSDVVLARNEFTNKYARSNNIVKKLNRVLRDISNEVK